MAALLWPGHLDGPLDGAPLDRVPEAILLGLVTPFLWWLQPDYLRHRAARALIVWLVLAKAGSMGLVRDGWCVQFDTPKPLVTDSIGRIHTWDVRADWRSPAPQCSAILTRPYREFKEFPVWFFNMPPTDNNLPRPEDRPPYAALDMTVAGYLHADDPGELIIETGESMQTSLVLDGKVIEPSGPSRHQVALDRGRHFIQAKSSLAGNRWTFVPLWHGSPIGSTGFAAATTAIPSTADMRIRGVLSLVTQIFAAAIVIGWIVTWLWSWRDPITLGFAALASLIVGWLGSPAPDFVMTAWATWSITALGFAILLKVPAEKQTLKGAFVLIGIPWLVFVTAVHASHIGRFSLYAGGDDMWMFQRFAYRIYLQGYWLQGGELTFWFQPFYRWIAGALHMLFGDSSMGEFWWDAICVMVPALFAHQSVAAVYGFRWGLAAAVLCLTIVMQGPAWIFIGIGLSDIASAGFIYLAALVILSARQRGNISIGTAIGAGVLAAIGFYTRLNNLPMAFASSAFGLSLAVPSRQWWRRQNWWPSVSWNSLFGVAAVILFAMLLFTIRTYHYTGVFSMLHGTTWGNHVLWRAGQPIADNVSGMISSLMMVLTFNDPPRFAIYALPLLIGAAVAVAAMLDIKVFRDIPLALVAFFLVACSGALAARGVAYAGRFSVHLVGAGCALTICAIASLVRTLGSSRSSDPARG
ncbi:MAG: glycosyltransferase family 39 protein [Cyanobacteria bacterium]|nr:glycosyltransferase family 39 protein [Cyanobacteriota bacterium]